MGGRGPRRRERGRSGRLAGALFALACLVVLALTFLLGLLVGRQWARSTASPASGVAAAGAGASGEAGGAGPPPARAAGSPPPTLPSHGRPRLLGEAQPDDASPAIREKLTFYQTLTAPLTAAPPKPASPAAPPADRGLHTVQVAAVKTREQAAALRAQLGADAYVVEVAGPAAVRYRVRIGAFADRAPAEALAARLRAERSLNAFVTTR